MRAQRKTSDRFVAVGPSAVVDTVWVKDVDKGSDFEVLEIGVPEVSLPVDGVPISSSQLDFGEVALREEVAEDALGGAFGDPDTLGNVSRSGVWVPRDAKEHVRVVGEKHPR